MYSGQIIVGKVLRLSNSILNSVCVFMSLQPAEEKCFPDKRNNIPYTFYGFSFTTSRFYSSIHFSLLLGVRALCIQKTI
jgi:hypothetical protein